MRIRVKSQAELLDLILNLQKTSDFDWFRGQAQDWPLTATIARLDEANMQHCQKRLKRFFNWAHATPGLEPITSSDDYLIAVAQHYGLPTTFIDFTTDPRVAAFFVTQAVGTAERECCIKCLNTSKLQAFAESWAASWERPPECLQFKVPNLWRMEAQRGVFLFCPYHDFERMYDGILTICFPATDALAIRGMDEIFPARKSSLEVLLDQYFAREAMITQTEALLEVIPRAHVVLLPMASPVYRSESEKNANCLYFSPTFFVDEEPPPRLHSWSAELLTEWLTIRDEPYRRVSKTAVIDVPIDWLQDPNAVKEVASGLVAYHLSSIEGARDEFIEFRFHSVGRTPPGARASGVLQMAQHYWDGVRLMPYDDEAIAEGVGNCIALRLWLDHFMNEYDDQLQVAYKVADSCFGNASQWRLVSSNGAETVAFVSSADLARCVRRDIGSFLKTEYKQADPYGPNWDDSYLSTLLQALWAPSHLFEFSRFADIFVRQLLPYQVVCRSVVLFEPARLEMFGLP